MFGCLCFIVGFLFGFGFDLRVSWVGFGFCLGLFRVGFLWLVVVTGWFSFDFGCLLLV